MRLGNDKPSIRVAVYYIRLVQLVGVHVISEKVTSSYVLADT